MTRHLYEVPDPWPARLRSALGRARCRTFGHPRKITWRRKMYGRICPSCGIFESTRNQ